MRWAALKRLWRVANGVLFMRGAPNFRMMTHRRTGLSDAP